MQVNLLAPLTGEWQGVLVEIGELIVKTPGTCSGRARRERGFRLAQFVGGFFEGALQRISLKNMKGRSGRNLCGYLICIGEPSGNHQRNREGGPAGC